MAIESKTIYFEKGGPENTELTLKLAKDKAESLNIKNIVIASYSGETGLKAAELFKDYNLIVVGGVFGFSIPNMVDMLEKNKISIEANGGKIIFSGHAFGMLGRAIKNKFGSIQVDEIISHVLRLFSAGLKVGCEIACMAVDAGLIRTDEEVIAIGGTATGADTAIVLKPSKTHTFFNTRILELICIILGLSAETDNSNISFSSYNFCRSCTSSKSICSPSPTIAGEIMASGSRLLDM